GSRNEYAARLDHTTCAARPHDPEDAHDPAPPNLLRLRRQPRRGMPHRTAPCRRRLRGRARPGQRLAVAEPGMPFGAMPVLELPGKPPLAHSNAILVLIGRQHGL